MAADRRQPQRSECRRRRRRSRQAITTPSSVLPCFISLPDARCVLDVSVLGPCASIGPRVESRGKPVPTRSPPPEISASRSPRSSQLLEGSGPISLKSPCLVLNPGGDPRLRALRVSCSQWAHGCPPRALLASTAWCVGCLDWSVPARCRVVWIVALRPPVLYRLEWSWCRPLRKPCGGR